MINAMEGSDQGTVYFVRDGFRNSRVHYAAQITFENLHEVVFFTDTDSEQSPYHN